jgi:hypothetical protein
MAAVAATLAAPHALSVPECAVCLEPLCAGACRRAPVVLAPCGHSLCSSCACALTRCPTCRSGVAAVVRNYELEKLLPPRTRCEHIEEALVEEAPVEEAPPPSTRGDEANRTAGAAAPPGADANLLAVLHAQNLGAAREKDSRESTRERCGSKMGGFLFFLVPLGLMSAGSTLLALYTSPEDAASIGVWGLVLLVVGAALLCWFSYVIRCSP